MYKSGRVPNKIKIFRPSNGISLTVKLPGAVSIYLANLKIKELCVGGCGEPQQLFLKLYQEN